MTKVHEITLRRMAQRQGLRLSKIRRMDRRAIDFGRYRLMAEHPEAPVPPGGELTAEEVEQYLTR
jgi:hypothetical protein